MDIRAQKIISDLSQIFDLVDQSDFQWIDEWNDTLYPMIISIFQNTNDTYTFVSQLHEYLRVKRQIGYKSGAWNFFQAFIDTDSKCNCVCSTTFILMSCYIVGYFPSLDATSLTFPSVPNSSNPIRKELVHGANCGAVKPNSGGHAFIVSTDLQESFETTEMCPMQWQSVTVPYQLCQLVHPSDKLYIIDTYAKLMSIIATNAIDYPRMAVQQCQMLLRSFPDLDNPRYRAMYVDFILNQESIHDNVYFHFIDDTINMIEANSFVGSFANILYRICQFMELKYEHDLRVLQRINRVRRLYTQEAQVNPLVLGYQELLPK